MTLKELQIEFLAVLGNYYPKEEIESFFRLLAAQRLGFSRIDITLNACFALKRTDLDFFLNALSELKQEKPIQYIIGETEFYGLPFNVTPNVLIPRPETEELVQWVLDEINEKRKKSKETSELTILDVGTGSGCIAISLAKHLPNAKVYALDISEKALKIAEENAERNNVKVHFIKQDILKTTIVSTSNSSGEKSLKFDVIISNPPYVRDLEKSEIKKNVIANEPHEALFVTDENPLLFYDKIADAGKQQLKSNGLLFFEINQYLSEETMVLLEQHGFNKSELKKDLFGNFRMIKASKPTLH